MTTQTDTIGDTSGYISSNTELAMWQPVTASKNSTTNGLVSVGINLQAVGAKSHVTVSIYADSSGVVGAKLAASASVTAISGWNDISVTGVTIIAGTQYWLGFEVDNDNTATYYKGVTYGDLWNDQGYNSWPNPAGSTTWYLALYNMRMTYTIPSSSVLHLLASLGVGK